MRKGLKKLLLGTAIFRIESRQYNFTRALESELRNSINKAVDGMSDADYLSEIKRDEAIANTLILIDQMILNKDANRSIASGPLNHSDLIATLLSICPLWPFC